jgi:hypothetical protein
MACPFFMPAEKADGAFPRPALLPLGAAWKGECSASAEVHSPNEDELRDHCNLGYAKCEHLPEQRHADAVRFAVASASDRKIVVRYACERQHRPGDCGTLEFNCHQMKWTTSHSDARLQRMAECFLEAYLSRHRQS